MFIFFHSSLFTTYVHNVLNREHVLYFCSLEFGINFRVCVGSDGGINLRVCVDSDGGMTGHWGLFYNYNNYALAETAWLSG